jgi:hypothetical protein
MSLISSRLTAFALPAALLVLSACAGPSSGTAAFAPPGTGHTAAKKQRVDVKIKIPKKGPAHVKRHGRFISPATSKMTIDIKTGCPANCTNALGYPITADLTPNSTGCTSTLASTLCDLTLELAPGTYTATLTTEDAQGIALSTAQSVALDVVAGATNNLSIVLSGIPRSVVTTPLGHGAFLANVLDADGNVIVGSGAPNVTAAFGSGSAVVITQPSSTSPNTFQAHAAAAGTATIDVTASFGGGVTDGCAQPGSQCTSSFTMTSTAVPTLFVVDQQAGTVTQYAQPFTGAVTATLSGLSAPAGIAFNQEGMMFVAEVNNGDVLEFASPYTGSPIARITNQTASAFGVAVDSHDNLFVSSIAQNVVSEFAPPYTGDPVTTISDGLNDPRGLAFDGSGNLYVAGYGDGNVVQFASPYASAGPSLTGLSQPLGVAVDATGDVLVANTANNTVVESAPFPSNFNIVQASGTTNNVYVDPFGNLDMANEDGTVTSVGPPYTDPPVTLQTGFIDPIGLAVQNTFSSTIGP